MDIIRYYLLLNSTTLKLCNQRYEYGAVNTPCFITIYMGSKETTQTHVCTSY